jgi:gliding motility-associated-like protein
MNFPQKKCTPTGNAFSNGCINGQMHPILMTPVIPYLLMLCLSLSSFLAYSQSCEGTLGTNLITGGDFGSGMATIVTNDPQLAPGYIYQNSPPPDDGFYTIASTTDFGDPNFCWTSQGDNSPDPNGYLMVVNATFDPGVFFERTLEVCDGINYEFSIDILNLLRVECVDGITPNIDILIDGVVVDQTGNVPQDETWYTYRTLITIPEGTDFITLTLRNNAPGGPGNDLGIDNLSLRHCAPDLILPVTTTACPDGVTIEAPAAATTYPTPHYQWQRSFDGGTSWNDLANENGATLFIANPFANLQYRVVVANGPVNFLNPSCRATSTATTIQLQIPLMVFQTPVICEGDTLQIGGQSLSEAGDYTIPLPGSSGCDSLLQIQLFLNPSFDQLFTQSLCSGDTFLGQEFSTDTLISFFYTTAAGCDSIVNYEIDVLSTPSGGISGDSIICQGNSTLWHAPAGFSNYQWSTGATTAELELNSPGLYEVTFTNSQGCSYTQERELQIADPFFDAMVQPLTCPDAADGLIEILFADGGVPPYEYQLNGGAGQAEMSFFNLASGTYEVLLEDAIGCSFSETLTIADAPLLDATLSGIPNTPIEAGDTLQLSISSTVNDLSYQWSGNGQASCATCASTNWLVLPGGQLQVVVNNQQGCGLVIDTLLEVLNPYRVYQPNAFSPNGDGDNDFFTLGLGSNAKVISSLAIFDRWGAAVYKYTVGSSQEAGWNGTRNGQPMPTGIYVYYAEIEFQNGKRKQVQGDLLLMR